MKIELEAIPKDYGFGLTIVVSAVNSADGVPVDALTKNNFTVTVIQGPSGWSIGDVLKISSGISMPSPGVYTFSLKSMRRFRQEITHWLWPSKGTKAGLRCPD
jgi:hypothetical protein